MKQADDLIERILFLKGLPNLQALGKLIIGETPQETLACNHTFQQSHMQLLEDAIALCEAEKDFIIRDMLLTLLDDTEMEHAHWLEQQLKQLKHLA